MHQPPSSSLGLYGLGRDKRSPTPTAARSTPHQAKACEHHRPAGWFGNAGHDGIKRDLLDVLELQRPSSLIDETIKLNAVQHFAGPGHHIDLAV